MTLLLKPSQEFFIRQQDDYSCGPACLATLTRLCRKPVCYQEFRALLSPCPRIGSCEREMVRLAQRYLPYDSHGEASYPGGLGIGLIIHKPTGDGHYVVLLGKSGDKVAYYDPFDHAILVESVADMIWTSETGHLEYWSINLRPVAGVPDFSGWQAMAGRLG